MEAGRVSASGSRGISQIEFLSPVDIHTMHNQKMRAQSVCAVIVTYNPQPTLTTNVLALARQVGQVTVIDNGSPDGAEKRLHELQSNFGCKVIWNQANLGIAVALNLGVKYAMESGFDWVCTFDQDSLISDGFISKMLEAYEDAPSREMVALIVPRYIDRESGMTERLKQCRGEILAAMTSGSLIPLSVIQKLGFFDESLYMDAVDIEFCLRARRNGMVILQSPAVLLHSLGRTKYYRLFGLRFGVTNHSAGRRYYMTRNRLRLLMRYAADWRWSWRESRTMLVEVLKVLFAEQNKWKKILAMAAGIADAVRGKVGKQVEL
jgi:rhamnosyltransferase